MSTRPVALVTGANKGIGFQVAAELFEKGYSVVLGCRDVVRGRDAMMRIAQKYEDVEMGKNHKLSVIKLDVSDVNTIPAAVEEFKRYQDRLDVLVNNAGVYTRSRAECLDVNFFGTMAVTEAFLPLVAAPKAKKDNKARIVTVSSRLGKTSSAGLTGDALALISTSNENIDVEKLVELGKRFVAEEKEQKAASSADETSVAAPPPTASATGFRDAYSASKALISAYNRALATRVEKEGLNVNVIVTCPGFTKTDLSNNKGFKTVEQGAETIVWAAADPEFDNINGKFFGDHKEMSFD